ncbi:hypothetical protein CPB85DRAFT_138568 [Mucidula mucida]|nr:hypothetical protein CPB85DRAFT_138568 [Mucidula mucida]
MHPEYQPEIIPWHVFVPHVHITSSGSDEPEFSVHDSSTVEGREADFTAFAGSLASAISDDAEKRRSTVPKPNASIEAWREMGVDDDALFPDEYLSRVSGMNHHSSVVPDPRNYAQIHNWQKNSSESFRGHRAASALLVVLMTEPSDQFQFLAPLLRLAQSIKIDLAAVSGLHYSLPPRYSYEKDLDKGIVAYVSLTLSNLLLVNVFLTVTRHCHSDLLRISRHSQSWNPPLATHHSTGNPFDAASFEDRLHHDFWRTLNDQTESELLDKARLYSFRCFNFLVAWYAVMMESLLTSRALGRTYPFYFGPEQLTAVILLQLQELGSAFSVASLDASDPVAFIRRFNTPPSVSADSTTDYGLLPVVPFLSLPSELHLEILSYLPARALLPIMSVCTQLRNICPELIYMDPLNIVDDFHPLHNHYISHTAVLSGRFSKLLALLLARPELCLRLRAFILRTCDVPADPRWGRSRYGFNINEPIVEHMINLSHLDLIIPHPACAHCADQESSWCKDRLRCNIPDIIRRWPRLRALTISYLPRNVVISSCDHDAAESPPRAPRLAGIENPHSSWSLQALRVKQSDHSRDALPVERQDLISLRHLVEMNAHSLRRLDLHPLSLGAIGDLQTFPVCPLVDHLSLRSALTAPLLQLFLERCFTAITFLHVSFDTTFAAFSIFVEDFGRLDLSKCQLLRRAAIDLYPISGFPPSMESLDLGIGFNVNHIWTTSSTMKAVQFDHKVSYQDGPDGDFQARVAFQNLGRAFPNLYCLDIVIDDFVEDKDNMMVLCAPFYSVHA